MIRGRSELERRERYIEVLDGGASLLHPALIQLVKQCLHNAPHERPTTDELLARLQGMKVEVEGEYGGSPIRLDMVRMRLAKEAKIKDRRIEELIQEQASLNLHPSFLHDIAFLLHYRRDVKLSWKCRLEMWW